MNRLLPSVLSLVVGFSVPTQACMNDYRPNVAAIERSRSVFEQIHKHVEKEPWDARRDRLRKLLTAGGDYRVKNDLATALAHTGEAAEALGLLEQIEAEKPGLYMTASNLGTVYELPGDNQKALEWIRRGIERNPETHEGTEWLHVRILEAKLAMVGDPKWLESNSILGPRKDPKTSNYTFDGNPVQTVNMEVEMAATGNRGEGLSEEQVKAALIHQLHERLQFVKPPDAIVGALLLDLGELIGKEPPGTGGAFDVFKLASAYLKDLPNQDALQHTAERRIMNAEIRQRSWPARSDAALLAPLAAIGAALGILIIILKRWIQRGWARERTHGPS